MSRIDELLVKLYLDLIKAGRRTIEEVPERVREYVKEALEK